VVELDGIAVRYPSFSLSLTLTARKGEVLSILGPSGSGKSTLLRLIAGFTEPDSGRVRIGERDVTALPPQQRSVGFVFQDYTLFPHLNVFQNVAYGLRVRGEKRDRIAEAVRRHLELVELPGYEERQIETLSGGERQRVAVARALIVEPEVLLLDEPFSSIDAPLRKDLGAQLLKLQHRFGVTVVFVTHSRSEALSISHRVAVMHDGSLLQTGEPEELYERPSSRYVAGFVGTATFLRGRVEQDSRSGVEAASGLRIVPDALDIPLRLPDDCPHRLEPGSRATVMLRPNALRLAHPSPRREESEPDAPVHPKARSSAAARANARPSASEPEQAGDTARVPVVTAARQFFGHYFEYECRSHDGTVFTVYHDRRIPVHASCELSIPPGAAVPVADDI